MPVGVAARPVDSRGYPVPAITPWKDGVPEFAALSAPRVLLCATERRCTVCGLKIPLGPVWRMADSNMTSLIEAGLKSGTAVMNRVPFAEGPGHLSCMLYSAVVCPYLARPSGRRGQDVELFGETLPKGESRGAVAGIVTHDGYRFKLNQAGMGFLYGRPLQLLTYTSGDDLLDELTDAIALESDMGAAYPPTLGDNDELAMAAAEKILRREGGSGAVQAQDARIKQRRQQKAARRRNR